MKSFKVAALFVHCRLANEIDLKVLHCSCIVVRRDVFYLKSNLHLRNTCQFLLCIIITYWFPTYLSISFGSPESRSSCIRRNRVVEVPAIFPLPNVPSLELLVRKAFNGCILNYPLQKPSI